MNEHDRIVPQHQLEWPHLETIVAGVIVAR